MRNIFYQWMISYSLLIKEYDAFWLELLFAMQEKKHYFFTFRYTFKAST
jgi:hypothetical protein